MLTQEQIKILKDEIKRLNNRSGELLDQYEQETDVQKKEFIHQDIVACQHGIQQTKKILKLLAPEFDW